MALFRLDVYHGFMSTNKEHVSWLAGLLTGWGIKESWAKIIAGAIIGALAAAGLLAAEGCTVTASQGADGSWSYSGEMVQPIVRDLELYADK